MSTTLPAAGCGRVTLVPPGIGPLIIGRQGRELTIRVGYDDALGAPLLLGAIPAQYAIDPHAAEHAARFTPWRECLFGKAKANVGVFRFELPGDDWLIFLIHAQPPGIGFTPDGTLPTPLEPLDLALARLSLRAGQPDTRVDVQAATCQALREWVAMDPATRPVLIGLSPPAPHPSHHHTAHTAPPAHTRFVLASCHYPAGMLDETPLRGGWAASPADRSLAALHQLRTSGQHTLDFLLLVGDQVYLDATAGLFDPSLLADRFGAPYMKWLARPMAQQAMAGLPVHTMLDDHEIADNWEPAHPQAQGVLTDGRIASVRAYNSRLLAQGMVSYQTFQGPARTSSGGLDRPRLWRQIGPAHDPCMVFMADTRTRRALRNASNIDTVDIMDARQFEALAHWLAASERQRPRFLACPSMVLPRSRASVGATPAHALYADAWDGYPRSRDRLLATLNECNAANVVLLSGDEHLPSISSIHITRLRDGHTVQVHATHAAGIYAPFPFANARPDEFLGEDCFTFEWAGQDYECRVSTTFLPVPNGFTVIDAPDCLDQGKIMLSFVHTEQGTVDFAATPAPLFESTTLAARILPCW